jgi:hypothetical protein
MADVVVAHKSTVRRWIDKIADATGQEITKKTSAELAYTIRQVGEGGIVGSALGAVHATVGLDVKGVPLDLVAAGAGSLGAMYLAQEDYSHDIRNVASHSFCVFTFRKTDELIRMKKAEVQPGLDASEAIDSSGVSTDDVGEEDPVVAAARDL